MSHIAAIHTIKSQLHKLGAMSEDDYRALLRTNYGVASSKDLSPLRLAHLRQHMDGLGDKHGLAVVKSPRTMPRAMPKLTPAQKKVVALWYALRDAGKLQVTDFAGLRKGLRGFVKKQTGCDELSWCKPDQTRALIEALKGWDHRD